MKKLIGLIIFPLITGSLWYFLSFKVAVVFALSYLYVLSLALSMASEAHKNKLVQ